MISDYNKLSGLQKVAILFSILGESLAITLVNDLDQTELRKIRAAMRGVGNVAFAVKKQVMEEFYFSFVSEKFQEEEESDEPKMAVGFEILELYAEAVDTGYFVIPENYERIEND